MSDLIERQVVIGIVQSLYPGIPRVPWLRKDWQERYEPYINAEKAIRTLPTAQPEIVRCKECKYNCKEEYEDEYMCSNLDRLVWDDWYCAEAERRTDGV